MDKMFKFAYDWGTIGWKTILEHDVNSPRSEEVKRDLESALREMVKSPEYLKWRENPNNWK